MEIFRLQIDSPKMNAYLSIIKKAALLGNITPETVMNYLHNSGIVFGINEEAIHKMLDRKLWNKQIKVAVGQPPVRGEDGHEKFYFKTDEKFTPKVHTDGSVDFKDLKIAQNVSEGKIIAERIPPTKGISGIDIYGKEVIAENGIEARLVAGDNTEFKDEKQNVLISTVDGSIKLRFGNTVVVDTVFEVVKDVDFSTGNLDVTGDVNVRGSVLSGFNVKATGNITVNGIIEDAIIEAGGDVMVRMGFTGTGKGVISADGQVVLKYINNQTVKAEEIFIGEQAFHSNLYANKSITMTKGKGTMIGGEAHAGKTIDINTCGGEHNIPTMLIVAEHSEIRDERDRLEEEIENNNNKSEDIMQRIMSIMERLDSSNLTDSQRRFLRSFENQSEALNRKNIELKAQIEKLYAEMHEKTDDAFIRINKNIYPRTGVKIGWFKITNDKTRERSIYRMGDNGVEVSSDFDERA